MVAVSALHLFAALQVDAQRGAVKRGFDIMRNDGIAAKDDLYVVAPDQVGDIAARARVYDCRAEHEENLALADARLPHLARDFMDGKHFDLFRRGGALHEGERLAVPGALEWNDTNTIVTGDYLITNLDFVHWFAGGAVMKAINHNGDIHLDLLNIDPLTLQAHLCGEIGGRVELRGQHAALLDLRRLRIVALNQNSSELHKFGEDQFKHFVIGSLDLHARVAWIGFMCANAHFLDGEVAAAIHDDIPGARQYPGVDNVTYQFNGFAC